MFSPRPLWQLLSLQDSLQLLQTVPPQLQPCETVDAGIGLIKKAAQDGASIITFPELWFPGFPKGNAENNRTVHHLPNYINNSLTTGSPDWNRLIEGIKEAGIYAGLAYSELKGDNIFIPSGSERWFFSDCSTEGLKTVVTTQHGRIGMLECGEHLYHTTRFTMSSQSENIHLGPFPYLANLSLPSVQPSLLTSLAKLSPRFLRVLICTTPILYASADTSSFNTSKTYDVDGQASWAIVRKIVDAYPEGIPKAEGSLVPHRGESVAWLRGELTTELGNEWGQ